MGNSLYLKLNWLSILLIFLLFAIGGLVRSTGSGMGCPDWPKCFGAYIPPTSEADLPQNYEEYFKVQRIKKTERFISLLQSLGLTEKAEELSGQLNSNDTHSFNAVKAYVEYFNRLLGALTGIVVFLCFVASFPLIKINTSAFVYTLLGFVAVFFNALLGAVVVNSNLLGGIVTAHFIAAFASICFFILARNKVSPFPAPSLSQKDRITAYVLMLFISIQVILGAELRELYDLLISILPFGDKVNALSPLFQVHLVVGILVLVIGVYQFVSCITNSLLRKYAKWIALLALAQLVLGPLALNESFQSISKLFHITFGAAIFVLQFYICTAIYSTKNKS